MADVITRLKLESGEYDSKVKRATQGLLKMEQECRKVNGTLAVLEKDQLQYVQSLGRMATVSTNTRGKIGELSNAYTELRMQYNRLTDEEKRGDFGKALTKSLDQLKMRLMDTKQQLADISKEINDIPNAGGGLFGGGKLDGMLQVFGGNLMTKAAGFAAGLASEMGDMIRQGVELAKQGEGIRIAFERLGRGDILDGLREATHGTVTDIELMKAAVKFNDFKLPVEELGTMLAFAQQKAKDTGQSVDYMVDSIVTGLGRKSLMILDNLGLSAAEIKEKMKQTGDMTKAVGEIIREQMAKAGDYVETAADRAAQANVSLQNKMEELGRKFAPVEEASNQLWTSMKIGILDIIGGPLATLLNQLTEAGRMKNALAGIGGTEQVNGQLGKLRVAKAAGSGYMTRTLYSGQVEQYNRQINAANDYLNQYDKKHSAVNTVLMAASKQFGQKFDSISDLKAFKDAYVSMKNEYIKGAQEIMNATKQTTNTTTTTTDPKKTTIEKDEFTEVIGLIGNAQERVRDLQKQISESWDEGEIARLTEQLKGAEEELKRLKDIGKEVDLEKMFPDRSVAGGSGLTRGELIEQEIRVKLAKQNMDADMQTLRTLLETQIKNGIEGIEIPSDTLAQAIMGEGIDIPDEYWSKLQDQINEKLKEMGIDPINIDFSTGKDSENNERSNGDGGIKMLSKAISGLNSIMGGFEKMGIEIPSEIKNVIGVIEGVMSIIQGVQTIISLTQTPAIISNTAAILTLEAAIWANTAASWFPFANGGIVPKFAGGGLIGKAAGGMMIPGNSYSGDNLRMPVDGGRGWIGVNSGELILNKSQQNNLANAIQGNSFENLNLTATIRGEQIRLALNNNGRRTGRGEYVQSRNVK